MVQITKVVVELYREFEITLAHPERSWRVSGAWLTTQQDLDVLVRRRIR